MTLLNTSPQPVNLAGWALADKNKFALSGSIAAGATLLVTIAPPMQLSNKGGIITVLNEQGLKVDGVSYTQQQTSQRGGRSCSEGAGRAEARPTFVRDPCLM